MPLQDLTPQLRTRLNRMERAVGWFVFVATALLVFGFGYYIYHVAEQRGWFKIKARFHTYVSSSAGLSIGDPVYLMGFSVGRITDIHPMQPFDRHNVAVQFEMIEPYFRYVWSEGSYVKINAAGFLNQRQLEVTRGTNGYEWVVTQPITTFTNLDDLKQLVAEQPGQWQLSQEIYDENSNLLYRAYTWLDETNLERIAELHLPFVRAYDNTEKDKHYIVASWHRNHHSYENFTPTNETAWLPAVETPPVSDQLQAMIAQVQQALPNVLALTNQITAVLNNTADATSNLNVTIVGTRPLLTNFAVLSGRLREPGSLGVWMLGTNGAQSVVANVDTNLLLLSMTLDHLADITSNLNAQVQANTNMLGVISKTVGDADDFVQRLKRFWLFRSTFKRENQEQTNAPPADLLSPRMRQGR